MTDIVLSANRLSWAVPMQHGSVWDKTKAMKKSRDKILERDGHVCQGCGWKSLQFQEIHHINGDHSDFRDKNLETLCPLCHQVFHPASASISGGAYMIWLPEISQIELNRLLFPLFSVLKTGTSHPMFSVAKAVWGLLEMRRVYLENQIGKSDPGIFGQMLLNLSPQDYEARTESLSAIKMLANPTRFETEIDYWKSVFEKEKSSDEWVKWSQSLQPVAS